MYNIKTFAVLFLFYISSIEGGKIGADFAHKRLESLFYCGDAGYSYDERTKSCYKFHVQGEGWTTSDVKCKNEGAYLTVIDSDLEAQVIRDVFAQIPASAMKISSVHFDQAAIGIHISGGSWKTVKGQILNDSGYHAWALNQPSNPRTEHCGSILRDATLNDVPCDLNLAYICEKEPITQESLGYELALLGEIRPAVEPTIDIRANNLF